MQMPISYWGRIGARGCSAHEGDTSLGIHTQLLELREGLAEVEEKIGFVWRSSAGGIAPLGWR